MIKKILKYIKDDIKCNYKSYIVFILIVPWFFITFDYNVYSPGSLEDLSNRIIIEDAYSSKGSFNLTYVSAKKGILPIILLSYVIPSWDLVSLEENRIENESENEIIKRNQIYLEDTSYDAVIAAFKEANMEYIIKNVNLTVTHVYEIAKTDIKVNDVIKSINDKSISNFEELKNEIIKYNEGDTINVKVLRNDKIVSCYSKLILEDNRLVIGVSLAELKDVVTSPKVEFVFKKNESGSSRGLMCALDIYNKITKFDLTKGDIIAGTGTIDENGIVGSIDGVKYKLVGAAKNKAKVFIVPADNYKEAVKIKNDNNYDIEIIEADNLNSVIEKLKSRN